MFLSVIINSNHQNSAQKLLKKNVTTIISLKFIICYKNKDIVFLVGILVYTHENIFVCKLLSF